MKWYKETVDNAIIIGNSSIFNSNATFTYSSMGFGNYRGFFISDLCRSYYKSKDEAIKTAEAEYGSNKPFVNGDIPFEIVFYNKYKRRWCCMTSNLSSNEMKIKGILKHTEPNYVKEG